MKEGWKLVPLKEVCLDFIVPQRDKPTAFDGDIPWCRIEDIEGRFLNGSKSGQKVTKALADKMNMHLCPKGTVISACSASIGNQAITTTDCYTNQTFIGLVVNPDLLYNVYLYFFLESQTKSLLSLGQGATIKYISKDKYKSMQIPLPSIEEQQRIVLHLDSAFSHIDKLKANAEKQLSEARALFQKALTKAMEPKEGWEEKTLGELCEIKSILVDPTEEQYRSLIHVGGANIVSGTGELIELKTAAEEELTSGKFTFDDNDVLYNKIRPYLIKVSRPDFSGLCSADMYPLTSKKGMTRDYLYYILVSRDFTDYAIMNSARAGMPKLNRQALFAYKSMVPPLSEQQRIVSRLDSLSAHVRELEEVLQKTIAECDALKQALLRKVFD